MNWEHYFVIPDKSFELGVFALKVLFAPKVWDLHLKSEKTVLQV